MKKLFAKCSVKMCEQEPSTPDDSAASETSGKGIYRLKLSRIGPPQDQKWTRVSSIDMGRTNLPLTLQIYFQAIQGVSIGNYKIRS